MSVEVIIPSFEPDNSFVDFCSNLYKEGLQVIIIDDGSGEDYMHIFDQINREYQFVVVRHAVNLGKGRALKTAFNYVLNEFPDSIGVVTADSDGQHTVQDIKACVDALENNRDNLILGCRDLSGKDIPWKSKFGNEFTRKVCSFLCGVKVSDTQTGLRGIPTELMKTLMETPGERFEFETNMLLETNNGIFITEVPIKTVYESKENHKTHFNPIRDSLMIYKVILSYSLSSFAATIVDFLIFTIMTGLGCDVWLGTAIGRGVAAIVNFIINRKVVFKSNGHMLLQLMEYLLLVFVSGTISAFAVTSLQKIIHIDVVAIKVIVETVLFFFNYYIQRAFIFVKKRKNTGKRNNMKEEQYERESNGLD